MYGDTVFHPETMAQFSKVRDDIVVAIDSFWKKRFSERSREDIEVAEILNFQSFGEVEYTGLVKFSPSVMDWISLHRDDYQPTDNFINLIHDIGDAGFDIVIYDVAGNWAEMNEENDFIHFILGSKADTLRRIQPIIKKSKICDQLNFSWQDWQNNSTYLIKNLQSQFKDQHLIVRSSSVEEDG